MTTTTVLARRVSGCLLDTLFKFWTPNFIRHLHANNSDNLFYLSFTCKVLQVNNLDTLLYLSFTCKVLQVNNFGHPVSKSCLTPWLQLQSWSTDTCTFFCTWLQVCRKTCMYCPNRTLELHYIVCTSYLGNPTWCLQVFILLHRLTYPRPVDSNLWCEFNTSSDLRVWVGKKVLRLCCTSLVSSLWLGFKNHTDVTNQSISYNLDLERGGGDRCLVHTPPHHRIIMNMGDHFLCSL